MIGWVVEPLPQGASFTTDMCDGCRQTDLTMTSFGFAEVVTRTAEPDDGGVYRVRPHHAWCPVVNGRDPNGCPVCGAAIASYDWSPGYSVAVPDPLLGVGHLVGPAHEVFAAPAARTITAQPRREKSFDELTMAPCGHRVRGEDARRVLVAAALSAAQRRAAAAAAVFAEEAALLDACEGAGYATVVQAYKRAVLAGSRDANGLRAALLLLRPDGEE